MDLQAAIKLTLLGFDPAPVRAMSQAMKELAGGPAGPGGRGGDPLAQANKSALAWAANMRSLRTTTSMLSTSIGQLGRTAERTFETIGKGIVGIGKQALKTRTEFEMFERQLATLLGSEAAGKAGFAEVKKFALISPLTLKETMKSVNLLLNYGFKFNELMKQNGGIIDTMTKAAIFSQRPLEQVARSIEKIREGYWRAQYLGPVGITPQFLKGLGIEWDSKKNRPAGLDATTGQQMFDTIMKGLVAKFKNFDPRTTLQVMGSNIQDAIDYMFNGIGAAMEASAKRLAPKFQAAIKNLTSFFDSGDFRRSIDNFLQQVVEPAAQKLIGFMDKLVEYMKKNPDALAKGLQALTTIMKDLFAIWLSATVTSGLLNFIEIILGIAAAIGGGPMGVAVGAGIAGVGLIGAFTALKGILDKLIPQIGEAKDPVSNLAGAFKDLSKAVSDLAATELGGIFEFLGARMLDSLKEVTAEIKTINGFMLAMQGWSIGADGKATQTGTSFLDYIKAALAGKPAPHSKVSPQTFTLQGLQSLPGLVSSQSQTAFVGPMPPLGSTGTATQDQLMKKTLSDIDSINMSGKFVCVKKTQKGIIMWGGKDAEEFARAFDSGSTEKTAANLEKIGQRLKQGELLPGDIIALDRKGGPNGPSGGHTGFYIGTDPVSGQIIMMGNSKGGHYTVPGKYDYMDPSTPYAGAAGIYGYANPFSPMRLQQQAAINRELYYDAVGMNTTAAGKPRFQMPGMDFTGAIEAARRNAIGGGWGNLSPVTEAVVAQYQAIVNATQAFVDGLQAQVDALTSLKGRLRGVRDNIAIGFQEMMGWDRGADRERTLIALRDMAEAQQAWEKEKNKARPDEMKLADLLVKFGETITNAQSLGASLRGKEGAEPFVNALVPAITAAMKVAGPAIEQAQVSVERRLSQAAGQHMVAASMLQQAAIALGGAANALAIAKNGMGAVSGPAAAGIQGAAYKAAANGGGLVWGETPVSSPAGDWATAGAPYDPWAPGGPGKAAGFDVGDSINATAAIARSRGGDAPSGYVGGFDYSGLDANYDPGGGGGGCADGKCGLGGAGLPGGSYPDKSPIGDKGSGGGGASNPAQAGFNLVGMFMGGLTAGLQAFAQAALNGDIKAATQSALQAFASSLISSVQGAFGSSPMGQLMGGIAGAGLGLLFGKLFHKKKVVDVRVVEPVRVFPDTTSMGLSANPASRLFSGRGGMTGTGITVQLELKGEAGEILTGKIVTALNRSFALGTA